MAVKNQIKGININLNKKTNSKVDVSDLFINNSDIPKSYEKTTVNLNTEIKKQAQIYLLENRHIKSLGNLIDIAIGEYLEKNK